MTHTLPRATHGQMSGIWNDSMFMIGGSNNTYQLLEYDMANDKLIDYGQFYFFYPDNNNNIWASAQIYLQINENIYYFLWRDKGYIGAFNMATKTYSKYSNNLIMDQVLDSETCLVKTDAHFVVVGGTKISPVYTRVNDVWSYNIADARWDNIYKPMNIARSTHSCTFVSNTNSIYVIGGYDGIDYLDTVEKLVVTDASNEWTILEHKLTTGMEGTRSLLNGNKIFIIGGFPWHNVPNVHSLDIRTDKIIGEPTMEMPLVNSKMGCALKNNLNLLEIFCSGGWTIGGKVDTIIHYVGPALPGYMDPPTSAPPFNLTPNTTFPPTNAQTSSQSPTSLPTASPTTVPTKYPTIDSTIGPTMYPSVIPTLYPTVHPTGMPSSYASKSPSAHPQTPTKSPFRLTSSPSLFPSDIPISVPTHGPSTTQDLQSKSNDEKIDFNAFTIWFYISVTVVPLLCIFTICVVYKRVLSALVTKRMMENEIETVPVRNLNNLSPATRHYLPKILAQIDWDKVKAADQEITDEVIEKVQKEIDALPKFAKPIPATNDSMVETDLHL